MKRIREVKCNLRLYDKDRLVPIPICMKTPLFLIGSHSISNEVVIFEINEKEYIISIYELERALLKIRLDGEEYERNSN